MFPRYATLDGVAEPVLIAQLTDTHVVAWDTDAVLYVDNNERAATAVAMLDAETPAPAAVVMTGDLVNDARPDEYAALVEILEPLSVPVLPLPGNHDDRELLRTTFGGFDWPDTEHLSWVRVVDGVRVIGLDTTRVGHHGAEFDDDRAEWLAGALAAPHDGATILAMHHPPFVTGIDWMDRAGFVGLDALRDLVATSPIDRIICGHMHRPIGSSVGGVATQVAMSTVQHVALDLAPAATVSLVRDPVGYQLHRVDGRDVVTHSRYIDTGEQTFAPDWAIDDYA
jgi:3',5'-cyclic AMP phosphodiesterase CpdA